MDRSHPDYEQLFHKLDKQTEDIVDNFIKFEQRTVRKNHREGLTVTEAHILEKAGPDGGRSMGEAAELLGVTTGTLTVAVRRLEGKGYLERRRGETDRRVIRLFLTRRGLAAYRLHRRFHARMVRTLIDGLGSHDCQVLARALETLNRFFDESESR
ncbi:MarR family transcriptional regulator [Oscillospiraceae bacterium OttesenSCG-928-F05]|nr:MarR family transcriptional regulator [Oscillospiraceae bacterium OttesenSCG-928-F05]